MVKAVRRQQALQAAEVFSGQMAAIAQADAEDRKFWSEQWKEIGASLQRLLEASGASNAHRGEPALLQAANGTSAKGQAAAPVASSVGNATPSQTSSVPELNLNPKSAADLMPELAMLKGLYEEGKTRITHLNSREKKSKAYFEKKQVDHDAKIAVIAARFKNHTLSEKFYKDETEQENKFFSYWQRVRERQRHQFHTSLKIQHGTLAKVKTMIEVYEKAISGKQDKAAMKKDLAKVGIAPEVVLLQEAWHSAVPFFGGVLAEVNAAATELKGPALLA